MKLQCSKCKKTLTEDLYQVKVVWEESRLSGRKLVKNSGAVFDTTGGIVDEDGDVYFQEYKVKRGLFFKRRGDKASANKFCDDTPAQILKATEDTLVVSEKSVLEGIIPAFISGYGCCGYSMGEPLKCSCGHTIGEMFLDCYEEGKVDFIEKHVDRVY
jgi:hypothetical protein